MRAGFCADGGNPSQAGLRPGGTVSRPENSAAEIKNRVAAAAKKAWPADVDGREVKRQFVYRMAEAGRRVLYDSAAKGASRRSRLPAEQQNREYAVLNYLEDGSAAKASPRSEEHTSELQS